MTQWWLYFNPRSHERSDLAAAGYDAKAVQFQSTLPREERLNVWLSDTVFHISIHAPTRGATEAAYNKAMEDMHISIHAPTRGATALKAAGFEVLTISIHAPTRGATHSEGLNKWRPVHFNPRSHERSDGWYRVLLVADLVFQSTLPREERQSVRL